MTLENIKDKVKLNRMELKIYTLEDRMTVASILMKNGYTVSQVKVKPEGSKAVSYFLRVDECPDNFGVTR